MKPRQLPMPTDQQCQQMGLRQCANQDCRIWVEPVNTHQNRRDRVYCQRHRPRKPKRNPTPAATTARRHIQDQPVYAQVRLTIANQRQQHAHTPTAA